MRILVIVLSLVIICTTLFSFIRALKNTPANKDRIMMIYMFLNPLDIFSLIFYVGVFGLIAGLLLL
ncbi:hypothetical protein DF281_11530 [Kurthia zopfii]|uniref:Uncharacterized protein n=2 Tax=Kurthia TaxID=1649 RepID=A0A2U3AIV1_9BACL|nr:hypothetical protein DF281_11530 [Kurthia zopfii]PWI24460.1 hypothetical protein DEX24_13430 [Kurthia sibirica]TDR34966.1 hypothetical protein DFR61_1331 [Kurthia zopfii]STX09644.1 Uncharacterised protein [Kurthia zopfii]